ncbi:hypothetical protein Tco_0434972 [Tanacetum coccineum]
MDRLPGDAIGIYTELLCFSGVRIHFSSFLLSVLKYFKVHISQLVPLDRRAIPDYLTWRHSCSCVSDDLPTDGYDRNDVERLCTCLIRLREMRERSCFIAHYCADSGRCYDSVAYCDEIAASLPDPHLDKKSKGLSQARVRSSSDNAPEPSQQLKRRKLRKRASEPGSSAPELSQTEGVDEADLTDFCAEIKNSLERDESTFVRAASAPIPRLGKRLGAPPSVADVSASGPSPVGTSVHASTSRRNLSLGGSIVSGHVGKSMVEVMRCQLDPLDSLARSALARDAKYDQISDDDFGTATLGEEINLTLFPLAPGPYHMPYPYEGVSSPLYTKEVWDGPHVPESNILCKDIFKDPDVCKKALDRTITPAELRRTEFLLPLELSNRVNVLSALLVSHGYELNSRYTNLVSSKALLQEKLDQKKGDVRLLCSEVTSLDDKLEKLQRDYDALGLTEELTRTDAKLLEQALTVRDFQNELALERSKSQGYKNSADKLRVEIAHFIGSSVEGLVRKLLSSDEFHVTLKISNFQVAAKAGFDKALVGFPTTPFPFLGKVAAAARDASKVYTDAEY